MPNIIRKNKNSTKISNRVGNELSRDYTNLRIVGIELMVLNGLSIRITLMAETLLDETNLLIQPITTTMKSS